MSLLLFFIIFQNEKLDAKFSQIQAHIQAVNSKMRTVNSFGGQFCVHRSVVSLDKEAETGVVGTNTESSNSRGSPYHRVLQLVA